MRVLVLKLSPETLPHLRMFIFFLLFTCRFLQCLIQFDPLVRQFDKFPRSQHHSVISAVDVFRQIQRTQHLVIGETFGVGLINRRLNYFFFSAR